MIRITSAAPLLLMGLCAACSSSVAESSLVQRTDSAGTTIVTNRGGDRPLDWSFTETLRLGGADEGPESFYQLSASRVAADRRGNLYVLDAAAHRVLVFSPDGRHLRTLGGKGGGPGELEFPFAMAVSADGSVAVLDISKPALVRWDGGGDLVPSEPLQVQMYSSFALVGDRIVTKLPMPLEGDGMTRERLLMMGPGDTTVVAAVARPMQEMIDFGCVGLTLPPRFTPEIVWGADSARVAAAAEVAYDIQLLDGDRAMRIRRALEPRVVTREMAIHDIGEGMTVGFQSREPCKVAPDVVLERQGYAPVLPAIGAIALAPTGEIWVRRRGIRDEPAIIDLFARDGGYLGTLPPASPFPVGFTPDGGILAVEKDDLDLDYLVVYRLERG